MREERRGSATQQHPNNSTIFGSHCTKLHRKYIYRIII